MAIPDNTLANGILVHLGLDDASGNLLDSTSKHCDGVAQGNIAYQQAGKTTIGAGYGVSPTSAAAIALLNTATTQDWNGHCLNVSVQVWFKANSAFSAMWGTKHAFIYKSSAIGDTYGWYFGVLPGGGDTISFRIMDAATSTYTASYVETDFTQFHHYVGTFDGTNVRLYRDGVQVAITFVSGSAKNIPAYIPTIGEGIDGILDELIVWNRALSAAEVTKLYGESGYIEYINTIRAYDTFPNIPGGANPVPSNTLYPATLTIGPFTETVQVKSGDNAALLPLTSPSDQWVVNGSNWTVPAWVNVSTPHVIAAGTVLGTLTPGQTLTIQIRSKADYSDISGTGVVSIWRNVAASGGGFNPVEPVVGSIPAVQHTVEALGDAGFSLSTPDGTVLPADNQPTPFDPLAITMPEIVVRTVQSEISSGLVLNLPVFENTSIDPVPYVESVTVDANQLMTLVCSVGPTNLRDLDLYWEIAIETGMLVIPISPTWEVFQLLTRQSYTITYQIPDCIGLNGRAARIVVESNGQGYSDLAERFRSPWFALNDPNFNGPCSNLPPEPPPYPGAISPLADLAPEVCIDLYDVSGADLTQKTIYAPTAVIDIEANATSLTREPQTAIANLPAGLYEFEYLDGALKDGGSGLWNYYYNTYIGQQMGGFWLKSGDYEPYYVVASPCFKPSGFVTEAAAKAASIGFKFLFLHNGGPLSIMTDYPTHVDNAGAVTFAIRSVEPVYFGTGEWTLVETTMDPKPYVADPVALAPALRRLSPGYARFRYTLNAGDNKVRSQDYAIRVWKAADGSIDAGFPYQPPKQRPPTDKGWGGTLKERRALFQLPPGSGNRG